MKTMRRALAACAALGLIVGLSACNSDTDTQAPHDHSAHESPDETADDEGDGHDAHDHGAMGHEEGGDMAVELKKVAAADDYPLSTCVVSGDNLDAMGDLIAYEYKGEQVQFCCAGCVDDFKEDPEKFMSMVRAAKKAR